MSKTLSLFWFRKDLRIKDNPAISSALANGQVLPIYIIERDQDDGFESGAASNWWLKRSLESLNRSLNGHLKVYEGEPMAILHDLIDKYSITHVYWNRCYEPWRIRNDSILKATLKNLGVEAHSGNASLLWEPHNVLKADGTPYRVFTPYYQKGCLNQPAPRFPMDTPDLSGLVSLDEQGADSNSITEFKDKKWHLMMEDHWEPGEQGAADTLHRFMELGLYDYHQGRDFPAKNITSKLSPYLHFGEISPNQVWYAASNKNPERSDEQKSLDTFQRELGWREFSYYLMYHFDFILKQNFNDKFSQFPWVENTKALKAWQQGKTGIPIVDAGMRELWQTGTMHNRVRMLVASLLTKNLRIHWLHGARWFWDCLLDADAASNSASWQWVAGTGTDAAPYFRVFNPVLQGKKFDAEGDYVRRYCPELTALPDKYIHEPWGAPQQVLEAAGIRLGVDYPEPIVDLSESRNQALEAYKAIK